jgi:UDPglucose 6-dehydrogenase
MKITIFGTGYVGLVTGACLAEIGHHVICMDIDEEKISRLNAGELPIYEPGLDQIVEGNRKSGRLSFTTDAQNAVDHGLLQFIAVGTPPNEDGAADLKFVLSVAETIATHMTEYKVIVDKSTVPVGTADDVQSKISGVLKQRAEEVPFAVVSNPEFLKEGTAIKDFMYPDRIVIGCDDGKAEELLRSLYLPFNRKHDILICMDTRSAELTKYAANAMLATKISFMNELANIAEKVGADIEKVRVGIGSDDRIGYSFIYPGVGYGGSCFPKDVSALTYTARQVGYKAQLLRAVEDVNQRQKMRLFEKVKIHYNGGLRGKIFTIWGLSFKPDTDDMRDAPSRVLMEALWQAGAKVQAYDPVAMDETKKIYGERSDLKLMDSPEAAVKNTDGLLLVTEWRVFQSPDFDEMLRLMKSPIVFDGRNIYDPTALRDKGFTYYGIGR